jgi:hypothetical protein
MYCNFDLYKRLSPASDVHLLSWGLGTGVNYSMTRSEKSSVKKYEYDTGRIGIWNAVTVKCQS